MNIEDANAIPMQRILDKLGMKTIPHDCGLKSFASPFSRHHHILTIHLADNTWADTYLKKGGKPLDFICAYLGSKGENNTIADAQRWLRNIVLAPKLIDLSLFPDHSAEDSRYEVRGVLPLTHFLLTRYLESRRIPYELAAQYIREIRYFDTRSRKVYRAIGIRNEDGGYYIRNTRLKANISPRTISFIRGERSRSEAIHIFKDAFDFLAVLTIRKGKPFTDDCIILNAWACINDVFPYVKNYGYRNVYTWLDNTQTGELATRELSMQFRTEDGLRHTPMNGFYKDCKDPNEWLASKYPQIG